MTTLTATSFSHADVHAALCTMEGHELDSLEFGVIGFDSSYIVDIYNAHESRLAALHPGRVIGKNLFNVVAPCLNNYLVAGVFANAVDQGVKLDVTIDYVLTLRMRPTPVRLRLLSMPDQTRRFVLIDRKVAKGSS